MVIGSSLAHMPPVQAGAKMHGPEGGTLEERFYRVCAALLLFGYTPEEIDRMIDKDIIVRPQRWNRYYGSFNRVRQVAEGEPSPQSA
jgi:hypothetical protein